MQGQETVTRAERFCSPRCTKSSTETMPLLAFVLSHWSRLLGQRRLLVTVIAGGEQPVLAGELFVGDEFRRGGKHCLDVVLRYGNDASPTVLVFEKASRLLLESELNAQTPGMLLRLGSDIDEASLVRA